METIVLSSRCELVYLYGSISKYLSEKHKVINIAYSDEEETVLRNEFSITEVVNFSSDVFSIYKTENFDLELCNEIDELILEQSNNRFNLNSSLQYDRTFQYISYNDSLILAQTYYKFWNNFIATNNITYLLHEPTSLYFNHIAALICKENSAKKLAKR